jgi:hypothetical protein
VRRLDAFIAGAVLALLLVAVAWAGLRPPPVDPTGKWRAATKGAILIQCPQCGAYAIIEVAPGTRFRIRHVHPLPEHQIPMQ